MRVSRRVSRDQTFRLNGVTWRVVRWTCAPQPYVVVGNFAVATDGTITLYAMHDSKTVVGVASSKESLCTPS